MTLGEAYYTMQGRCMWSLQALALGVRDGKALAKKANNIEVWVAREQQHHRRLQAIAHVHPLRLQTEPRGIRTVNNNLPPGDRQNVIWELVLHFQVHGKLRG